MAADTRTFTKDYVKYLLMTTLTSANNSLEEWKEKIGTPDADGKEVLELLQVSSELFKNYVDSTVDFIKINEPILDILTTKEIVKIDDLNTAEQDAKEAAEKAAAKALEAAAAAPEGGGKKKKSTKGSSRKLKGGNQVAVVKEFGAPNTNLIYNASGLITSAKDPVAIGMTGTERLIDTHAPFATGMESGAFSGMHNLPASITSEISPALGFMGGAHSKTKRATKSRK